MVQRRMRLDTFPGLDQIYPRTMREAGDKIAKALAEIHESSEVPADWRVIIVVPLFKKCCKEKRWNKRIVDLSSAVGKLLVCILRDKIYMIRDCQHGLVVVMDVCFLVCRPMTSGVLQGTCWDHYVCHLYQLFG